MQLPHPHRTAPGAPQGGVTLACSGRCSCLPACLPAGLSLFMLPGLLVRLLYSSPLDAGYEIKVAADGKLLKHRNLNTIDWQGRWQGMGSPRQAHSAQLQSSRQQYTTDMHVQVEEHCELQGTHALQSIWNI